MALSKKQSLPSSHLQLKAAPVTSATSDDGVITYARELLTAEAQALLNIRTLLSESFSHAVQAIAEIPAEGRVVISGMGKAGFIGMKISATFASTGTPSYFLHPAEAIHGDLGRYTRADIALILSNSGQTPEIVALLPHLKRMGSPIIGITGQKKSALGTFSDICLTYGEVQEAGPHGIAPTTSTTVMLALGDALAMSVFKAKKLSPREFALYHPGGNIGRALMVVSEFMRQGDEFCCVPEQMLTRAVIHQITITKGKPGAAAIVDKDGKLSGIFTDGNLRRQLEHSSTFLDQPIGEIMTRTPKTVRGEHLVQEATRIMTDHQIDQVIVVDEQDHPIGLIDIQDVVDLRTK